VSSSEYKILAVDDDPEALEAVVDLLRADGYEVHAAGNLAEAEELLRRETYHLVVTDLVMPGGSGIDLTRLVHQALPETRVVVVTGRPSLPSAVEALKSGAADYLEKPVDPAGLRRLVEELLADRPRLPPNRLLAEPHVDRVAEGTTPAIQVPIGMTMKEVEREVIARTLDANRWNKNRTARILGISRRSLYNKLERYAITRPGAEAAAPVPAPVREHRVELDAALPAAFVPPAAPHVREAGVAGT
jgi:DNA-binding NtrC family response regulator